MSNNFLFLVTVPNIEEGKKIAHILVENKLAACVNIISGICSIYEWKENIEEDNEFLLIIKTTEKRSDDIIQKITEIHSYDVPECIGFRIEKGSESYLNWINEIVD
jgi:periplasmic divalent cation tolerance protein